MASGRDSNRFSILRCRAGNGASASSVGPSDHARCIERPMACTTLAASAGARFDGPPLPSLTQLRRL